MEMGLLDESQWGCGLVYGMEMGVDELMSLSGCGLVYDDVGWFTGWMS